MTFWKTALPIAGLGPDYGRSDLRGDLLAGLTVAILAVPQGVAYAFIAGLPIEYGIYAGIAPVLAGTLFLSSPHLVLGITQSISLMTLGALSALETPAANRLSIVSLLALMVGGIHLLFALFKLSRLMTFVSGAVMTGYMAGIGVIIVWNQLGNALGIEPEGKGIGPQVRFLFSHLSSINPAVVILAAGTVAFILFLRKLDPRIPGPLLAVLLGSLIVAAGGPGKPGVPLVRGKQAGEIARRLPPLSLPLTDWDTARRLLSPALAIAILGAVEALSISQALAQRAGHRLRPDREFIGMGIANVAGSFFSSLPCAGSFTRSALNHLAGGRTALAAFFSALFVSAILLVSAPLAGHIPVASLAGLLFVVAFGMVDLRQIRLIFRTTRRDTAAFAATFVAAVLLPLHYAVYLGVFLSIVLFLREAKSLRIVRILETRDGRFKELSGGAGEKYCPQIEILHVEGELFFGAVAGLREDLVKSVNPEARVVVLRLKRARHADASGLRLIENFQEDLKARGAALLLCGVTPELLDAIDRAGLREKIGPENIHPAQNDLFASTRAALARAFKLISMERCRTCEMRVFEECGTFPDERAGKFPNYQI